MTNTNVRKFNNLVLAVIEPKQQEFSLENVNYLFLDFGEFRPMFNQKCAKFGGNSPKSAKFRPKFFGAKYNCADSPISNKFHPKKITVYQILFRKVEKNLLRSHETRKSFENSKYSRYSRSGEVFQTHFFDMEKTLPQIGRSSV
jgi:hypothetical protein